MRRIAVVMTALLALGITGCAQPPKPPAKADRFDFKTPRTPYAAAICIARNARLRFPNVAADERLLGEASMEVVVRSSGNPQGTLAVTEIHNDGVLSRVTVLVMPAVRADHQDFARQLIGDC